MSCQFAQTDLKIYDVQLALKEWGSDLIKKRKLKRFDLKKVRSTGDLEWRAGSDNHPVARIGEAAVDNFVACQPLHVLFGGISSTEKGQDTPYQSQLTLHLLAIGDRDNRHGRPLR